MNNLNDNELDNQMPTEKPVTSGKLGVYDRPQRSGLSPMLLIILVILALIVGYVLWQFVF
jgi:hypothetical protein